VIEGTFKFKEHLTYRVKGTREEGIEKLKRMESHYWKLDPETVREVPDDK
jgi:hypothetical protein